MRCKRLLKPIDAQSWAWIDHAYSRNSNPVEEALHLFGVDGAQHYAAPMWRQNTESPKPASGQGPSRKPGQCTPLTWWASI